MNATETAEIRVTKTYTVGFGSEANVTTSVVWQGADIEELNEQYPPSDILFADPLGIQEDIDGGHIRTSFTFEQLIDGEWTEIDDPRTRITPMTELERAIDAENRQRFPGDYITEDDDDEYYDDEFYEQYYCGVHPNSPRRSRSLTSQLQRFW